MFSPFEIMVAGRYLRARKAEGFVSLVATFSFLGIMLGVGILIVVMSVMNGFKSELIGHILGLNGHISVYSESGPLADYKEFARKLQTVDGVTAAIPIIEGQALMSLQGSASGVMVRGLSREDFARKPVLSTAIKAGTLDMFQGDAVGIGIRMAERLQLKPGSDITLIAPKGHTSPFGTIPRAATYSVAFVFDSGMYEYDSSFVYMPLETAQAFFHVGDAASAIELMTKNPLQLDAVKQGVEIKIAGQAQMSDWREMNGKFYNALDVERNVMFLILTLLIVIAAFNIVCSMFMLVKDKGHDIAIMRTMGATRGSMMRIFMLAGATIGVVGTAVGALAGISFALNIESIRQWLQGLTHTELFAAEIYFLSHLPAEINWGEVVATVAVSLICTVLATIYPAWRAARLDPVEALRYE